MRLTGFPLRAARTGTSSSKPPPTPTQLHRCARARPRRRQQPSTHRMKCSSRSWLAARAAAPPAGRGRPPHKRTASARSPALSTRWTPPPPLSRSAGSPTSRPPSSERAHRAVGGPALHGHSVGPAWSGQQDSELCDTDAGRVHPPCWTQMRQFSLRPYRRVALASIISGSGSITPGSQTPCARVDSRVSAVRRVRGLWLRRVRPHSAARLGGAVRPPAELFERNCT